MGLKGTHIVCFAKYRNTVLQKSKMTFIPNKSSCQSEGKNKPHYFYLYLKIIMDCVSVYRHVFLSLMWTNFSLKPLLNLLQYCFCCLCSSVSATGYVGS